jgi:hypothetical protein
MKLVLTIMIALLLTGCAGLSANASRVTISGITAEGGSLAASAQGRGLIITREGIPINGLSIAIAGGKVVITYAPEGLN